MRMPSVDEYECYDQQLYDLFNTLRTNDKKWKPAGLISAIRNSGLQITIKGNNNGFLYFLIIYPQTDTKPRITITTNGQPITTYYSSSYASFEEFFESLSDELKFLFAFYIEPIQTCMCNP